MTGRILVSAVLLFVIGDVPLWAREMREPQAGDTISIDARSGTIRSLRRQFPKQDQVLITVQNIDPFVHQYRIVGTAASYPEGAVISRAIETLFGVALPVLPALALSTIDTAPNDRHAAAADACAPGKPTIGLIKALRDTVDRRLASIEASRRKAARRIESYEAALGDWTVDEARLLRATQVYAAFLDTSVATLAPQLIALDDTTAAYAAAVASFTTFVASSGGSACPNLETEAIKLVIDTVLVNRLTGRADSLLPPLQDRLKEVDRIASNPTLLHQDHEVGGFDDPSVVSFVVQQSPAGTDTVWRTIAEGRLTFGERRFGIAVGLAGSGKTHQYGTIHRFKRKSDSSTDSVLYIISENATSTTALSPTVALSMLLGGRFTFQVGAGVRPTEDFKVNYMAGLSYPLLDGRLLFGAGMTLVEQQKLLDGFAVGDSLPELQTSAPTKTVRSWKPYLSVLFRAF